MSHGERAAVVVYRHGAHIINLFAWADRNTSLPGTRLARRLSHGLLETE